VSDSSESQSPENHNANEDPKKPDMRRSVARDMTPCSPVIDKPEGRTLHKHRCENLKFYVDMHKSRKCEILKTTFEIP
jgi:hypothetical protein